jgi:hypothetical protein
MSSRLVGYLGVCLSASLCLLSASCTPLSADAVVGAQDTVDAITSVQPSEVPEHFNLDDNADIPRAPGDWDVNAYFGVLKHLSVEPGYVIDYLYTRSSLGGYPFIYARPSADSPYQSYEEYLDAQPGGQAADGGGGNSHDYLDHIQIDDTREGYFQFVALRVMAAQFYQFWHAGYDDTTIVCDSAALERLLSGPGAAFTSNGLPKSVIAGARKIDLQPTVEFVDDSTAIVRVVTFSKWGGFAEVRFEMARQLPHSVIDVVSKTLVPYDCGVSF